MALQVLNVRLQAISLEDLEPTGFTPFMVVTSYLSPPTHRRTSYGPWQMRFILLKRRSSGRTLTHTLSPS